MKEADHCLNLNHAEKQRREWNDSDFICFTSAYETRRL